MNKRKTAWLLCGLLAGCAAGGSSRNDAGMDAPDSATDAATDAPMDTTVDSGTDSAADAGMDVALDVASCMNGDGVCAPGCTFPVDDDCEPCVDESDLDVCFRLGNNCGSLEVRDACGTLRRIDCSVLGRSEGTADAVSGECIAPTTCGGLIANVCGCDAFSLEDPTRWFSGSALNDVRSSLRSSVSWPNIAVDALRVEHVVYTLRSIPRSLVYLQRRPGIADFPLFESTVIPGVGNDSDLAVTPGGVVHVSHGADGGGLRWARRDLDGTWTHEEIDALTDGFHSSVALDASGTPHVVYRSSGSPSPSGDGDLVYARRTGDDEWSVETIDELGDVGWYTSMEIDSAGEIHVAYFAAGPFDDLKYARRDVAGTWAIETVDSEGWVGVTPSILTTPTGVVIASGGDDGIKVSFRQTDGSWNHEIAIPPAATTTESAILRVNPATGSLHVASAGRWWVQARREGVDRWVVGDAIGGVDRLDFVFDVRGVGIMALVGSGGLGYLRSDSCLVF